MLRITPSHMAYSWGSIDAIPRFSGGAVTGEPVAEAWYGAHPSAPSRIVGSDASLREEIRRDPDGVLGADVVERFGAELPFLLKIIAPAAPLSLQVHPSLEQAALGWVREERTGLAFDAPDRTYRDSNHKPEMVLALEEFEALSGFRAPRRALEVLSGLDTPLIDKAVERVRQSSSVQGMRNAFEYILLGARDRDIDVLTCVDLISARLAAGESPSVHTDRIVLRLAQEYPGDRGILAALLLNPVTLQPGEVMFVPSGCVHAYISGLGVELMASSDNVVRAGLTRKYVDARALVDIVDVRPAPPMRVAPEHVGAHVDVFYAPVEDFELAVISPQGTLVPVGGAGPRIVLGIDGESQVLTATETVTLRPGAAVFLADEEDADVTGHGRVVRASVP